MGALTSSERGGSTNPDGPGLVVGIGASAGGLDAFRTFFANMPAGTGMTFVLIQHLSPDHKSLLAELLGKVTAMPVTEAKDNTPLAADHVYVIPPDATLTIEHRVLRLATPAPAREHRRPIDTFFSSLAEDQGENAVCIVLSGTGSDGARGLRLIKEHGGLTLAQAQFDHSAMSGMPQSAAATGLVDNVMPVEKMPARLLEHQGHLREVAARKDGDGTRTDATQYLSAISTLLRARIGHDFSLYKEKTLVRRVQRRMQVLRIDAAGAYVDRLRKDPGEIDLLFREFLIGVTQFFRDPEAFELLRTAVIPRLLEGKTAADPLRIWVPACATGEEVYSIAILVRDELDRRGRAPTVQIFGTDIDEGAVAVARAGRYRLPLTGVSAERSERWFARDGDDYCPVKAVREMCVFSAHSVIKDPAFSKLDLISCRNLMIYLGAELQDRVVRTFHYALRPGGALFLGSSEGLSRNPRLFSALDKKHRVFQRLDAAAAIPAMTSGAYPAPPPSRPAPEASLGEERIDKGARRALEKYFPVYVIIDTSHQILRFSGGEVGRYLGPSPGTASLALFDILRKPLRPVVRGAVQAAFLTREAVTRDDVALKIDGESRAVRVIVAPFPEGGVESGLCVVAFQDAGLLGPGRLAKSGESESVEARALEQELRATKTQLQAAIDEFEIANEEMKSANEEYQSVNEELQSSNEELETSKEEMQSVNEELQTVNSEMSSKNDLLVQLNSDLKNLFESTEIATIFLDNALRVKSFTPGVTEIFHLREADRGRPIHEVVTLLSYSDLQRDVKTVLRKLAVIDREVRIAETGATFIMRIRPYRTVDNVIDGAVVTFVDITDRKRAEDARRGAQDALSESQARLRFTLESAQLGDWDLDLANDTSRRSPRHDKAFGYDEPVQDWGFEQFIRHVHPDDRPAVEREFRDALAEQKDWRFECRVVWPDESVHWIAVHGSIYRAAGGEPTHMLGIVSNIDERKQAEGHALLLMNELDHRVKNILAVVSAVISQTLKASPSPGAFAANMEGRIAAIARAHSLLTQKAGRGEASLRGLVTAELAPYDRGGSNLSINVSGPDIALTPKSGLALALAIHELASNAAKYGALSTEGGRLTVTWEVAGAGGGRTLRLAWIEAGGPRVRPPTRKGFGTTLIERTLSLEFDATVKREFLEGGLRCAIDLPLTEEVGHVCAVGDAMGSS